MATALVGTPSTVDQAAGSATCTITKPGGIVVGEDLFGVIHADAAATVSVVPTGWGLVLNTSAGAGKQRCILYHRIATGSETATFAWTVTGGLIYEGGVARYTGNDATGVDSVTSTNGATSGTTLTANTITPTVSAFRNLAVFTSWASATLTPPTGGTPAWSTDMTWGSGGDLVRVTGRNFAASGATGNATATQATGDGWTAQQVAIRDASAASFQAGRRWPEGMRSLLRR